MSEQRRRLVVFLSVAVGLAAVLSLFWPGSPPSPGEGGIRGLPGSAKPIELSVPSQAVEMAVVATVKDGAALRQALAGNAWLQEVVASPLGSGFIGHWLGFAQTRGEDLRAPFSGLVFDFILDELLGQPFLGVWFAGAAVSGKPVVIVPSPSRGARAAFTTLVGIAAKSVHTATHCPGQVAPVADAAIKPAHEIVRWSIADQSLFASFVADRMVLGASPIAVLHGLCSDPELPKSGGEDLEIALVPSAFGREAQLIAHVLGLGPTPRLLLSLGRRGLEPKGISSELTTSGRLAAAPLSLELLRLVPDASGVLLTFQLNLPELLSVEALTAHFAGTGAGPLLTRQVAVVWNPRGDAAQPTELAVVWSRVEDQALLGRAFTGANKLATKTLCKQLVLASTPALLERFEKSCAGSAPSLANQSADVVRALGARASLGVYVQVGRVLAQLLDDAYRSELPKMPPPAEIEAARKKLDELGGLGLRGVARDRSLIPEGFRS